MKMRELIERVDRSDKNKSDINQEKFLKAMNLEIYLDDYEALEKAGFTQYYLAPWYCTDTWVGYEVIYYHDKPICLVYQSARKNDVEYHFVGGKQTVDEIFPVVAALFKPSDRDVITLDMDEEANVGIKLGFNQQILDMKVLYEGELVEIVRRPWNREHTSKDWSTVDIMVGGEKKTVNMNEITIPWRVTNG